jgi:hypothetical protein
MKELENRVAAIEAEIIHMYSQIKLWHEENAKLNKLLIDHMEAERKWIDVMYDDLGEITDFVMPVVHKMYPGTYKPFEDFMKKWQERRGRLK